MQIDYKTAWTRIAKASGYDSAVIGHNRPGNLFFMYFVSNKNDMGLICDSEEQLLTIGLFDKQSPDIVFERFAKLADNQQEWICKPFIHFSGIKLKLLKSKNENFESLLVRADLALA